MVHLINSKVIIVFHNIKYLPQNCILIIFSCCLYLLLFRWIVFVIFTLLSPWVHSVRKINNFSKYIQFLTNNEENTRCDVTCIVMTSHVLLWQMSRCFLQIVVKPAMLSFVHKSYVSYKKLKRNNFSNKIIKFYYMTLDMF